MMAARSLIGLFRQTVPELLHKKDRGRPTEASVALEPIKYGAVVPKSYVPGAEVLSETEKSPDSDESEGDSEEEDDDSEVLLILT